MNLLIVGCGYLGCVVARQWRSQGGQVHALTRSEEKAARLVDLGIRPLIVDWYRQDGWPSLPEVDAVLMCVSHASVPNLPPHLTHVAGLEHLTSNLKPSSPRLVYLSTTGVYGLTEPHAWIDESCPVVRSRPGATAAIAAEEWLLSHGHSWGVSILRAAGIYGPGRIPRLEEIRRGEKIAVDPSSYLNLIHVEDLASVAVQALVDPCLDGIYSVADGSPVLRGDYYGYLCRALHVPPLEFEPPNGSAPSVARREGEDPAKSGEPSRKRGEGSKRISIAKLRSVYKTEFRFPDYRAGLQPLIDEFLSRS